MERPTLLIVDDTEANLDILVDLLGEEYEVMVAVNGEDALDAVEREAPALILLDIMMPGIDGYEVCQRLKADARFATIPIIFLTAMTEDRNEERGLELGAVDYLTKPFNPALIRARVRNHLALKQYQERLEQLVEERTRELLLTQQVTFESLATLAEYRDPETGGHIRRTQTYVQLLAETMAARPEFAAAIPPELVETVHRSAPLHDIGKVGVPDHILLKPGKLTPEEFDEMKRHTIYGRDAIAAAEKSLGSNSFLRIAREIAESHHERWDGTGYPHGLAGESISIYGRIMAVADVYDALTSKRVYKPAFSHEESVRMILEGSGTQFDPRIVAIFEELHERFREVAIRYADSDEERAAVLAPAEAE